MGFTVIRLPNDRLKFPADAPATRAESAALFLIVWLGFCQAMAGPPILNYLEPAGVQAGTTVEVTVAGTLEPGPIQLRFNDERLTAEPTSKKGIFTVRAAPNTPPGLYFCRAISSEGISNLRPFLVGSFPEISEPQGNDLPATAPVISLPTVVNGKLEKAGDVDCYKVMLKRGQTLVAALEANRRLKSPIDAILQLTTPSGFVLTQNHDRDGLDPRLEWTAAEDGEVVVRVFAFPAIPDSAIRFSGGNDCIYRLTLTTGGYAEHPWPLAVNRHRPVPVALIGPNIPRNFPPIQLPLPLSESESRQLIVAPGVANPVTVAVESIPCLTADALPPDLTPPFLISGQFDKPGQTISIPFHGKKGIRYSIATESRTLGYPATLMIHLVDSQGNTLTRLEPSRVDADPATVLTPKNDGQFLLQVRELFNAAGRSFVFRIRITQAEPDFEITSSTDRIVVPIGKTANAALTLTTLNNFNSEIQVVAENLPEALTMTVGAVTKKGATWTIPLQFQAKQPVAAAPFRIAVYTLTDPKRKRYVTVKNDELEQQFHELWIVALASRPAPPSPSPKS